MIVNPGIRRFLGSAIQRLFNSASFYAPLTHSLVPERGTGSPTFTRASTATVTNNDGYLVTALAGEARFEGARRVRNLLSTTSEDFSNAAWAKLTAGAGSVPVVTGGFTDPNGGSTAYRLQANAGGSGGADYSILRNTLSASATFLPSIWIKSNTGASQTVGVGVLAMGQTVTATTEWQRLSVTPYASASNIFDISAYPAANGSTQSIDVLIWRAQLEDVTAQTTQTAGEYVSVGVESAPYYHGSFVDGVKAFPYDINGSPIPSSTLLGYLAEGARTNLCLQSNAFTTTWTDIFGSCAATQNVIGPDGATSAWTLTDDNAAGTEGKIQTITLTAAAYTFSVRIKKTTGAQGNYPVIYAYTGAATPIALATIDTSNGVATAWTSFTGSAIASGVSARCRSFSTDYWLAELTFTATAAVWTVGLIPATTSVATYAGPDFTSALTGSAVFYGAQVELGSFASSYIPTTTIAVTRNADVLQYSSSSNISNTVGACYAEVASSNNTAGSVIIGDAVEYAMYLRSATAKFAIYDGTNVVEGGAAQTFPMASPVKAATTWGGSTLAACSAGSSATTGAFDGSLPLSEINIGCSSGGLQPWGTIRNVSIWQRALSSSELQAVTA